MIVAAIVMLILLALAVETVCKRIEAWWHRRRTMNEALNVLVSFAALAVLLAAFLLLWTRNF